MVRVSIMELTKLTVDLGAAAENFAEIKKCGKKIICVVKSDAYGHGAVKLSHIYTGQGAYALAVKDIEEAFILRDGGIKLPVLILSYTPPHFAKELAAQNFIQSVFSPDYAAALDRHASFCNVRVQCHIKTDTGMHRFGLSVKDEDLPILDSVFNFKNLLITGLYSHLSCADIINCAYTDYQISLFKKAFEHFNDLGIKFKTVHLFNTYGYFSGRVSIGDAIRPGLGLYGYGGNNLKPLFNYTTTLVNILRVNKGDKVGYGGDFTATRDLNIGVIPIGYANGFNPKKRFSVKIGDRFFDIVGRVCMNHAFINLEDYAPQVGALVTVASTKESFLSLAAAEDRSIYETLCLIGSLNKKEYI